MPSPEQLMKHFQQVKLEAENRNKISTKYNIDLNIFNKKAMAKTTQEEIEINDLLIEYKQKLINFNQDDESIRYELIEKVIDFLEMINNLKENNELFQEVRDCIYHYQTMINYVLDNILNFQLIERSRKH